MKADAKIIFFPGSPRGAETDAQRNARLGRLHLMKGEWDKSVSYLTAAIVFEPKNGRYWRDLGRALAGMGDRQLSHEAWLAGAFCAGEAEDTALVEELEALIGVVAPAL